MQADLAALKAKTQEQRERNLGAASKEDQQIQTLKAQLADAQKQIAALQARAAAADSLQAELRDKTAKLDQQTTTIKSLKEAIAELKVMISGGAG